MQCPNCGAQLKKEALYCEVCGNEIRIVPDFEPEIENSITETLSTVAMDMDSPGQIREGESGNISENPERNKRGIVLGCLFCVILLFLLFVLLGIGIYRDNYVDIQIKKATAEFEKEHYTEAAKLYESAILADQKETGLLLCYADCLYRMGEVNLAINEYLEVISLDEHNENAYTQLIAIYDERGEYNTINHLLLECTDEKIQNEFQSYMAKEPEFNYRGGSYDQVIPLKLIAPSSGKIYYTMDGSTPGRSSLIYTAPIFLKKGSYEVKAVYINDFDIASQIVSQVYSIEVAVPNDPDISPQSGEYHTPQLITVNSPEGCSVYYTTDGSAPNENSSIYGEAIPMKVGISTYKFVAISKDGVPGNVVECTYQLNVETSYSADEALKRLRYRLVEVNRLADAEGNLTNMNGKNIYVYNSLRLIEDKTMHVIYEYYQEGERSRNMTGNIYCVDADSGWVYKLIKGTGNAYILEPV